ncbi:hypothetical protein BYT27DRAFT_7151238 [Phlegmacium glaucopus]|nr:hypothetical protein BYT27DRAFT_7151238 [Phlegmacium glaucopus]
MLNHSNDSIREFRCLIEGDHNVFNVEIATNKEISNLKDNIHKKGIDRPILAKDLTLLKVNIDLDAHTRDSLGQLAVNEDGIEEWKLVSEVWKEQPAFRKLHIIAKLPPATALKRKRDDPTDISRKLFDLWTKPAKWDLQHLKEYLEKPLDPDWKIPLPHAEWRALLVTESIPPHACSAEDLELLFKQSEDETAVGILDLLKIAITRDPVNPSGTKNSLVSFWDRNIRDILERCLGVASIRDSTETGRLRPDFGLLLANTCVFRGAEKRLEFTGTHPRDELKVKTRWVYNPAPYILGYYAIGVKVVLTAILPPGPQGQSVQVMDLILADLSSRRERIKNALRMIKLCGVLGWLQQVIGEDKDRDMRLQFRDSGKLIEYFSSHVRKTYGLANSDDGKERVKHLKAIYASLISKGVPNVDRLKKAEIQHYEHGSYVDLEPRGIDEVPKSPLDVRNAVVCVLEALKVVAHADPPVFHRDIRWQNIMQSCEDSSKWFLIDWEDASFAPTKAAPHLSQNEHSPNVYKDNHGADVDIWAVGRLIFTTRLQVPALRDLGQMMMEGHVLNAEQGLREICNLPPF